jgi:hypothetical protein
MSGFGPHHSRRVSRQTTCHQQASYQAAGAGGFRARTFGDVRNGFHTTGVQYKHSVVLAMPPAVWPALGRIHDTDYSRLDSGAREDN